MVCNKKQATEKNWKKNGLSIDWEKFDDLHKSQNGRCAICNRTPAEAGQPNRELAVDHAHGSSAIRGLLCMPCNTAIGKLGDDPALIRKAASYVECGI